MEMQSTRRLYLLCGPSLAGKSTICERMVEALDAARISAAFEWPKPPSQSIHLPDSMAGLRAVLAERNQSNKKQSLAIKRHPRHVASRLFHNPSGRRD
jgi:hypothetical protein